MVSCEPFEDSIIKYYSRSAIKPSISPSHLRTSTLFSACRSCLLFYRSLASAWKIILKIKIYDSLPWASKGLSLAWHEKVTVSDEILCMCQPRHSDHVISEHIQGERQICSYISASMENKNDLCSKTVCIVFSVSAEPAQTDINENWLTACWLQ